MRFSMRFFVTLLIVGLAVACSDDEPDKDPTPDAGMHDTNNGSEGCSFDGMEVTDNCPQGQACKSVGPSEYVCADTCDPQDSQSCPAGEICVYDVPSPPSFCEPVPQCDIFASEGACSNGCVRRMVQTLEYDGTTCTDIEMNTEVCVGLPPTPCLNGCPGAEQIYDQGDGTFLYLETEQAVVGDEWEEPDQEFFTTCSGVLTGF